MGLPRLETEIGLLRASKHGVFVGDLASNQLGAGAEMRLVEESTPDEVDPGTRVQQQREISGGPIRQGHGECEENLNAFSDVSRFVELDGGVLAERFRQGCGQDDRRRVWQVRGNSSLRISVRSEEMAIAPGVGVATAGHAWVQCPPYLAAVSPPLLSLSLSLPLHMLGRRLARRLQHLLLLLTLLIAELNRVHALPRGVQHPRQSGQSPLGCLLLRLHERLAHLACAVVVAPILLHPGFHALINSRVGPKMKSTVPSIPFLHFRGASIAALGKFQIFVGFHYKILLFGDFLYEKCS